MAGWLFGLVCVLYSTVSDKKKAPWQKNGSVFQRFLAVLYSVAFDV
jgi:hypothetical protein